MRLGGLSESFQRGYLEDIDFCLRAREHGFRNVCAASVYVGHAGSRSFQGEKRALVLHNLDLLDQRFPHFRAESAAFVAADPVRPARQAIERLMPIAQQRPVLILTGPGAVDAVAQARAQQLVSQGHAAILLALQDHGDAALFPVGRSNRPAIAFICIILEIRLARPGGLPCQAAPVALRNHRSVASPSPPRHYF